jgi:hypothetical protein
MRFFIHISRIFCAVCTIGIFSHIAVAQQDLTRGRPIRQLSYPKSRLNTTTHGRTTPSNQYTSYSKETSTVQNPRTSKREKEKKKRMLETCSEQTDSISLECAKFFEREYFSAKPLEYCKNHREDAGCAATLKEEEKRIFAREQEEAANELTQFCLNNSDAPRCQQRSRLTTPLNETSRKNSWTWKRRGN